MNENRKSSRKCKIYFSRRNFSSSSSFLLMFISNYGVAMHNPLYPYKITLHRKDNLGKLFQRRKCCRIILLKKLPKIVKYSNYVISLLDMKVSHWFIWEIYDLTSSSRSLRFPFLWLTLSQLHITTLLKVWI